MKLQCLCIYLFSIPYTCMIAGRASVQVVLAIVYSQLVFFAVECECGTSSGQGCYMDWKHGNFFETKEKAEAAIREWITEEAQRLGILKETGDGRD